MDQLDVNPPQYLMNVRGTYPNITIQIIFLIAYIFSERIDFLILYRPPPHPPSIGRLRILPLSAASASSLYRPPPTPYRLPPPYRPPPHPPLSAASTTSSIAASTTSLYRPPPQPPSIGRLHNLPLSAASTTSLYRPPPQPPSIGRLHNLPLSAASSTSLYRPPPQPPSIGRLHNLPLSAASTTSHYRPTGTESSITCASPNNANKTYGALGAFKHWALREWTCQVISLINGDLHSQKNCSINEEMRVA
ncbi:hypothetical protein JTE90_023137 [Oedothorax gibbosus]|uniref:Uncharacterized protein n=1 Tax=Oedothorax gibbosus TaxID=931172 RepID=A0AAV6USW5_9ARAC|nr:hypothetical protein JTE90_023137 [Oedothorax gibbosus]